jgi:hypothetical protein
VANGRDGTGNYRFYAYSSASIANQPEFDEPPGEPATVCSVFVWYVLKSKNAILEGPGLEPEEAKTWLHGATGLSAVDKDAYDGLYFYPELKRREAAEFMWASVFDMVMMDSFFDPLFWPIAAGIANQLVNCFTWDDCDSYDTDHTRWRNPGDGRTVSPDNILLWDPPTDQDGDGTIDYGVYGHSERLVFRSGGYKRVYRWKYSQGVGDVSGVVKYESGALAAGAAVILDAAGGMETDTDTDGYFEFRDVPAGVYDIEAQKQEPDEFLSSRNRVVEVVADETATIALTLLPPAENFRKVNVTGSWFISDMEWICIWPFCLPDWDFDAGEIAGLACRVDPYTTPVDWESWHENVGDADLYIDVLCVLLPQLANTVFVQVVSSLDGDDAGVEYHLLPANQSYEFPRREMYSRDSNWWCGSWQDFGAVRITISNEVQDY